MADVKWIKITTDIFDDEKILLIESLPDAYAIITVWFKLLCLAGKQNNSGVFIMGRIAYTDKMLATIFRMKEATVTMALKTFEEFGMVEIVDGVITIPNWGKHQNLDQLESKKEYMKKYMKEYREKQRLLSTGGKSNCKTNSETNVRQADKEEDKERDIKTKIKEKEKKEKPSPLETNTTLFERVYLDYCLSENLISKLREWMKYKTERKDEYTEQGLRSLLRRIENKYLEFHKQDQTICELIDDSMANNWKGIIFEKLKTPTQTENKGSFDTDEFFDLAMKKSYVKNPRSVLERQAAARMEAKKEQPTVLDAEYQQKVEKLKKMLAK